MTRVVGGVDGVDLTVTCDVVCNLCVTGEKVYYTLSGCTSATGMMIRAKPTPTYCVCEGCF